MNVHDYRYQSQSSSSGEAYIIIFSSTYISGLQIVGCNIEDDFNIMFLWLDCLSVLLWARFFVRFAFYGDDFKLRQLDRTILEEKLTKHFFFFVDLPHEWIEIESLCSHFIRLRTEIWHWPVREKIFSLLKISYSVRSLLFTLRKVLSIHALEMSWFSSINWMNKICLILRQLFYILYVFEYPSDYSSSAVSLISEQFSD